MKSEHRAKHSLYKFFAEKRPFTTVIKESLGYLVDLKSEFWKGEAGRESVFRLRLVRAHGLEHT
jgi:hypothetical protein